MNENAEPPRTYQVFIPALAAPVQVEIIGALRELPSPEPAPSPPAGVAPRPDVGINFARLRPETQDAIAWFFLPEHMEAAATITLCECGSQNPVGCTNLVGERSYGIWQINQDAHAAAIDIPGSQDIWTATEYAARLFYARGARWTPWLRCADINNLPR